MRAAATLRWRGFSFLEAAWAGAVPARRFGGIFKARAAWGLPGGALLRRALRAGAARGPLWGTLHRPHDAPSASE